MSKPTFDDEPIDLKDVISFVLTLRKAVPYLKDHPNRKSRELIPDMKKLINYLEYVIRDEPWHPDDYKPEDNE